MRVISCFVLKYFGCLCGGVIAALFRTSTSAQLCCFLLRTHSMPDNTSCICIPYREVHYRQSVKIQQEIAIPDVPLERSPSYSAALRRLAVIHLTVSLKNAKLKWVKMLNFCKIAKLRCRELCEPQNREINVSWKFHVIRYLVFLRIHYLTIRSIDEIKIKLSKNINK